MNLTYSVTQEELLDVLLNVAPTRPVFIWGAPGIGKSALVEKFSGEVGLPCVSLLGSQLAPEDIIGIPQIRGNTSEFLPPKMIARKEPYVLFLDELNADCQFTFRDMLIIHIKGVSQFQIYRIFLLLPHNPMCCNFNQHIPDRRSIVSHIGNIFFNCFRVAV